jgi:hypothetical protein
MALASTDGGIHTTVYSLPQSGLPSGANNSLNYFAQEVSWVLNASPLVGTQQMTYQRGVLSDNLLTNPSFYLARVMINGEFVDEPDIFVTKVDYVNGNIELSYVDQNNVLFQRRTITNVTRHELSGSLAQTSGEAGAYSMLGFTKWVNPGLMELDTDFLLGSAYLKYDAFQKGDYYVLRDCINQTGDDQTLDPCKTNILSLEAAFPLPVSNSANNDQYAYSDGTLTLVDGVEIWIANILNPHTEDYYDIFVKIGSEVYEGIFIKDGTQDRRKTSYDELGNTQTIDYGLLFNKEYIQTIKNALNF